MGITVVGDIVFYIALGLVGLLLIYGVNLFRTTKTSAPLSSMALENPDPKEAKSILEFNAVDIDGNIVSLEKYKGFVTYIVNVASK